MGRGGERRGLVPTVRGREAGICSHSRAEHWRTAAAQLGTRGMNNIPEWEQNPGELAMGHPGHSR